MNRRIALLVLACGLLLTACGGNAGEADSVASPADAQDLATAEGDAKADAQNADFTKTDGPGPDACVPQCGHEGEESECGPDGCGGTCGECEAGAICGEADYAPLRVCFNPTEDCPGICAGEDAECGTVWTGLAEPEDCACGECPGEKPVCTVSQKCSTGPVAEGEMGWPCTENKECLSGWCVSDAQGSICTVTCADDCPAAGFVCRTCVPCQPEGDWNVCLPLHARLCKPCETDDDCNDAIGGVGARCVDQGPAGTFCGSVCGDGICPEGYQCKNAPLAQGGLAVLCVPEGGKECECSPLATAEGANTTCYEGNLYGKCLGERFCAEGALTPCDAQEPQQEVCDGLDNNCNGKVDEGCACVPDCMDKECGDDGCGGSCGDCDDGDNGTVDSCDPIAGCKHAKKECIPELPDPCKVYWDDPATGACLKAPKDCDDGSRKRYRVRKGKRSSAV